MPYNLLKGKKGIIFGALNEQSLAWKIAQRCSEEGAQLVLTNAPIALRMGEINKLSEDTKSPVIPADVTSMDDLKKLFEESVKHFGGGIDFILHSIGMSVNMRKGKHYTEIDSFLREIKNAKKPADKALLMSLCALDLINSNTDSALLFIRESTRLSLLAKDELVYATSLRTLGWYYYRAGNNDSADFWLRKSIDLYKKHKALNDEAAALRYLSDVYKAKNRNQEALSFALSALSLYEKLGNESGKAQVQKLVGIFYRQRGMYEKAKEYFYEALAYFNKNKKPSWSYLTDLLIAIGITHHELNKDDSALWYYKTAAEISHQNQGFYGEAIANEDIGELYAKRKSGNSLDSALVYYRKALLLFQNNNMPDDRAFEEINIGQVLLLKKDYAGAVKYLKKSLNYFENKKSYEYAATASIELSLLFKEKNDAARAYYYLKKSQGFKDSVQSMSNKQEMARMFAIYETEKKDKEIKLLNIQGKLAAKELLRNRIILYFSIGLFLMAVVISFMLYNRNVIRQRLKEYEIRDQIASDLHDDLGSSLSSIYLLTQMAITDKSKWQETFLTRISANIEDAVNKVSDIIWQMNPHNDKGEALVVKLEKFIYEVRELHDIHIEWHIDQQVNELVFPIIYRKNIYLMIKETLNNTLKYANASAFDISMSSNDHKLFIKLSDNGKGFDEGMVKAGNGFRTLKARANLLNGTCLISSKEGEGTLVNIAIPIAFYKKKRVLSLVRFNSSFLSRFPWLQR